MKVDVFAAGAMLFMLLTGCPPFESATRNDRSYKLVVYRGYVRTFLERNRLPMLSDEVRHDCALCACVFFISVRFTNVLFKSFVFFPEKPRKSAYCSQNKLEPLEDFLFSQDSVSPEVQFDFFCLRCEVRQNKSDAVPRQNMGEVTRIYCEAECLPITRRHATNLQG